MKKKVLFYKLILEENPQLSLFETSDFTLIDSVKQLQQSKLEKDFFFSKDKFIFQIISLDEQHIFGTYGKIEDFKNGDFIRGRDREDLTIQNIPNLIESYTYFYVDLNTNNIATMNKSGLSSFKNHFKEFISFHFRLSSVFHTRIEPLLSENISTHIGKNIPVNKIKATYFSDKIPENEFLNLKETLNISTSSIHNATITLSMITGTNNIIDKKWFTPNNFSELVLENNEEFIDTVNQSITKKVTIEIDSNQLKDTQAISNELKSALSHVIQNTINPNGSNERIT